MQFLKLLETLSPKLVAKIAFWSFSNPQTRKLRPFEIKITEEAKKDQFFFQKKRIMTYQWGTGLRKALLVHGWEGRASNFGHLIPVLLANDFQVFSFDAPAHGQSQKTKNPFLDYIEIISQYLKKQEYDLILTHSAGSILTLWALYTEEVPINQMIICTTPDRFEDRFDLTIKDLGLSQKTKIALMNLMHEKTGIDPLSINASEFVKSIKIKEAIFIQDKNDRILPFEWTESVQKATSNSELISIEGTGHFRMLWSAELEKIIGEKIKYKGE